MICKFPIFSVQNETFEDLGREINGIHFNKDGNMYGGVFFTMTPFL